MKKLILILLCLWLPLAAMADDSKLAPELRNLPAGSKLRVIVQYNQPVTSSSGGLLGSVLGGLLNLVGSVLQVLPLVNGLVADLSGSDILTLSNQANVTYISPDRSVSMLLSNAAPAINAPAAWKSGYTGKGIGVAVIDSGISGSNDLNGGGLLGLSTRVAYNQSFVSGDNSIADGYGHGTHVAGLIAGNGAQSTGISYFRTFKGIAPSATIVNLKVLDKNGAGTDSQVISAISQAIALKSNYNIRVINLSLGRPVMESYRQDPLCQAVEKAWKAGIVVVVAAGNDGRDNLAGTKGYGTIASPANDPYVITVGSMKPMGTPDRSDDLIATYSSKGPSAVDHIVKPDIVAPGNLLVSLRTAGTLEAEYPDNNVPYSYYVFGGSSASSPYFSMSGTSMAAAVTSGAVADLLQKSPSLTPDQVKARLMKTAYKTFPRTSSFTDTTTGITYTDQYDIFTIGAGYLDLAAALASSDVATGSALSPLAYYDSSTGKVSLSKDSTAVWGSSTLWSSTAVWGPLVWQSTTTTGSAALWGSGALWGSAALWGSSGDSGFAALWGAGALWGSSTTSGSAALWGAGAGAGEK